MGEKKGERDREEEGGRGRREIITFFFFLQFRMGSVDNLDQSTRINPILQNIAVNLAEEQP